MTDLAERGSLGVRELQPPFQLSLQDAIFRGQIFGPRQQLLEWTTHRLFYSFNFGVEWISYQT